MDLGHNPFRAKHLNQPQPHVVFGYVRGFIVIA
jgi:hypothetical protein